jgi:hypothetical protein
MNTRLHHKHVPHHSGNQSCSLDQSESLSLQGLVDGRATEVDAVINDRK